MFQSFFQGICRVGIFMICARAIVHFRAKDTYEKYLKLLVSIMIMIQVFMPLGALLSGEDGQQSARVLEEFRQEMEAGMKAADEEAKEADRILREMTLKELQRQMEEKTAGNRETSEEAGEGGGGEGTATGASGDGRSAEAVSGAGQNVSGEISGDGQDAAARDERIEVSVETVEPISVTLPSSGNR